MTWFALFVNLMTCYYGKSLYHFEQPMSSIYAIFRKKNIKYRLWLMVLNYSLRKNKMRNKPLVSIVTPVYNGEKFIAECIQSVLEQTYTNWNYVIVNNCSTDKTLKICRVFE